MIMSEYLKTVMKGLQSNEYLNQFSSIEKEKVLKQFYKNIVLTDLDFSTDIFKEWNDKKIKTNNGFKSRLDAEQQAIFSKLQTPSLPPPPLKNIFEEHPIYTRSLNKYKESIESFNQLLKKAPNPYSIEDLRGFLVSIQNTAKDAIKYQQLQETQALENEFTHKNLTDELEKMELRNALKKIHQEQFSQFGSMCEKEITKMDQAATKEMDRIIFLAQISQFARQKKSQEMIDELKRLGANNPSSGNVTISTDDDGINLSGIKLKDLAFIYSLTGKKLTHNPDKDSWHLSFKARIFDPLYYMNNKQTVKTDYMTATQAVKACGYDEVTITFNFIDKETMEERARAAYEAAIESGFEPSKIHLKGNSGKIDPNTLFKGSPPQPINQPDEKYLKEQKEQLLNQQSRIKPADMKQQLKDLRAEKHAKDMSTFDNTLAEEDRDEQTIKEAKAQNP